MNKKIIVAGAIILFFLVGIASANLISYFGQITGTIEVTSPIITGGPSEDLLNKAKTSTWERYGSFSILGWALAVGDTSVLEEYLSILRNEILQETGQTEKTALYTFSGLWETNPTLYARRNNDFAIGLALGMQNPQVLDSLTTEEKEKIDVLAKALIISGAWTTHPDWYWKTLDGSNSYDNVNLFLPMVSTMVAGSEIIGQQETMDFIQNYNHEDFITELENNGFFKIAKIFDYSYAPIVNKKIRKGWHYEYEHPTVPYYPNKFDGFSEDITLENPMDLFLETSRYAFSKTVPTKYTKFGYIKDQPNSGQLGMLFEFNTGDSPTKIKKCVLNGTYTCPDGGPANCIDYGGDMVCTCTEINNKWICSDHSGYEHLPAQRDHLGSASEGFLHHTLFYLLMDTLGYLDDSQYSDYKQEIASLNNIGSEDLFYKMDAEENLGYPYISYSNGKYAIEDGWRRLKWARIIFEELKEKS